MCGIAGRMEFHGAAIDAAALSRARDSLLHRGPDDAGLWIDGPVGLAHRRLSVLDLSPRGHQPMHHAAAALSITFNGEVYNYRDVRAELVRHGHAFTSDSDTEVILAAWAQWGPTCLQRFNGMFAFALWDARRRRLFLVRDRLGVKPLYYRLDRQRLVFGSTPQALLAFGDLSFTLSRSATERYLDLGYVAGEASIFEEVQRLGAGCMLAVDAAGAGTVSRWWSLQPDPPLARVPPAGASDDGPSGETARLDALESLLESSVALRLISDVPVGAFLSGGIDSSLVVALMRRHSQSVRTYTIGFDDPRYDESVHAEAVAGYLGVQNTRLVIGPSDLLSSVDALTRHYDEPFADSSALPTLLVSGLARREVTVALSGDGGDELFGGYPYYPLAGRLEPWRRRAAPFAGLLSALARHVPGHRAALALSALSAADLAAMHARFRSPLRLLTRPLFARDADGGPAAAFLRDLLDHQVPAGAQAQRLMDLDLRSYLESDILVKVDRASMAHALEARNPFLDWRVVEFARALPASLKVHPSGGKRALRLLLARHLPQALIDRPKAGFIVPIRDWLRAELRGDARESVEDGFLVRSGWIDRAAARLAFEQHVAGTRNHEHLLWAIMMFERWHRRFCP
ncbi:MAG: asparagine synthase (glutamine-hydrolyzing) [bacterium]|jgi:asparagine synthase (glutamine-hydrolysing)|nr:asparagine synthase (glutamine-hydrolyzing) [Betaproteobacteria bacterium]